MPEPSLVACVISTITSWAGSIRLWTFGQRLPRHLFQHLYRWYDQNFNTLASFWSLCHTWSHTSKDRFSCGLAHFCMFLWWQGHRTSEPRHHKTHNMACAPSEDSNQPGHLSCLMSVIAVGSMGSLGLNFLPADSEVSDQTGRQRRLWSDWVDAQADLNLRWAHMAYCWFCRDEAYFFLSYGLVTMLVLFCLALW